jgi:hypothetical protein
MGKSSRNFIDCLSGKKGNSKLDELMIISG